MRVLKASAQVSCLLLAACQAPPAGSSTTSAAPEKLESNIIQIAAFFDHNPFGPVGGKPGPGGFRVGALYLLAPVVGPDGKRREQGVFGDGIIHVYLWTLEKNAEGKTERHLAREWVFTPEQARGYRSLKRYPLGYGYQLHCAWGDADVLGKNVEIEIRYERTDGRIITSRPRSFRVPTQ